MSQNLKELQAIANLAALAEFGPGNGLVVGSVRGNLVQVFWETRNGSDVGRADFFDCDKEDHLRCFRVMSGHVCGCSGSLMREVQSIDGRIAIVGNGGQVSVVADGYADDRSPHASLFAYLRNESDPERLITAVSEWGCDGNHPKILIAHKHGDQFHAYEVGLAGEGFGYGITTLRNEPLRYPLQGDAEEISDAFMKVLGQQGKKVLIGVKFIPRHEESSVYVVNGS